MSKSYKKEKAAPAVQPAVALGYLGMLFPALIVVLGLLAYHNSFRGVFVFDDVTWIERGSRIRQDLWPLGPFFENTLRPVLFYTLAVNYRLGELDPWGYHVFNVAVHLAAALLLYGVVRRTLLLARFGRGYETIAPWLGLAAASIWVVHPLQTQAVNYIIQRCESLAAMCMLLMLYGMVRAVDSPRPWLWYGLAIAVSTVGMGAKPTMVVAPVLAVMYDRVFLSASWHELIRRRGLLYVALAPGWLWLIFSSVPSIQVGIRAAPVEVAGVEQIAPYQTSPAEPESPPMVEAVKRPSVWEYARSQPAVILHYLRLVVWPHPLCLDYRWQVATPAEAVMPGIVVAAMVLASLVALLRWPPLGFVACAFFLLLAPTSSVLPITDLAFEHRMYLPSAAVILLGTLAVVWLVRHIRLRLRWTQATANWLMGAMLLVACGSLTAGTIARNRDYHSRVAMWESVLAVRPNNVRAKSSLAIELIELGHTKEPMAMLLEAHASNPTHAATNGAIGLLLLRAGRAREALPWLHRALQMWPTKPGLHMNMGAAREALGEWDAAIYHFREATRLGPGIAEGFKNLGFALVQTGQTEDGIKAYREALRLDADYYDAHTNLGAALAQNGRLNDAISHFERAAQLRPGETLASENLAMAYADAGRYTDAIRAATRAAELAERAGQAALGAELRARIREYEQRASSSGSSADGG